jgi:hypothetical protein
MELLLHYQLKGLSDEWNKTIMFVYNLLDRLLQENNEILLSKCDSIISQTLMYCIIKVNVS